MNYIDFFSEDLINGILDALSGRVVSIILYGSVARGTHTEESDVDVAIILKSPLDAKSEDKLSDFVVDLNLKYDKVFSVIDIEEDTFEKWGAVSPFYRNVKKEGIVLWKAA
ncbi:MAG: nucleotidyltransferase domain-containing protein [Lachnospiraceae bacterium]|nr:nucleotidyltransferase domain-containing protein [Lachnospiraceae bacterium]